MKTFANQYIIGMLALASCATAPKLSDSSSTIIDPTATSSFKASHKASKSTSGFAEYKSKSKMEKAQWLKCEANSGAPFVAYFHESAKGNDPQSFCDSWNAQVLLNAGFNVLAVNRPSFFGSTGVDDFAGADSLTATLSGLKASGDESRIVGFWGVDTGVITASFASKSMKSIKWILLGNGFYDLEVTERLTKSDSLKSTIQKTTAAEGESAIERRSIAWDAAGIPKLVAIYHAKNDDVAPLGQADTFTNQLRTAQTKVFFDEVDGIGHDIPWQSHYQIVEKALKSLSVN